MLIALRATYPQFPGIKRNCGCRDFQNPNTGFGRFEPGPLTFFESHSRFSVNAFAMIILRRNAKCIRHQAKLDAERTRPERAKGFVEGQDTSQVILHPRNGIYMDEG
jgi:hypothetical protein